MAFLEQQHVVHRDLAARNVLVGKDLSECKLSDLGATRVLGTMRYVGCFFFLYALFFVASKHDDFFSIPARRTQLLSAADEQRGAVEVDGARGHQGSQVHVNERCVGVWRAVV